MCNRYTPPRRERLEADFNIEANNFYHPRDVFPRGPGYFLRAGPSGPELIAGQWGLIPWFAKEPNLAYSTNNARSEELATKASFKQPWARGQRCIIPAECFWEPCWETGKNIWHRFTRSDRCSFALAGLWSQWTDKATGEIFESYTMLTMNADAHPIMSRMHKPDPKLPADKQDKRMVCVLEPDVWEAWLDGPAAGAGRLLTAAPAEVFEVSF